MSGVCVALMKNILTNPCDWTLKQRLVKQISSYKYVDFSTFLPL